MALELTIYNRHAQTCKSGKEYIGYTVAFASGAGRFLPLPNWHPFTLLRQRSAGRSAVAPVGSTSIGGCQDRSAKTAAHFAGPGARR
jgi:hypothetical protein